MTRAEVVEARLHPLGPGVRVWTKTKPRRAGVIQSEEPIFDGTSFRKWFVVFRGYSAFVEERYLEVRLE